MFPWRAPISVPALLLVAAVARAQQPIDPAPTAAFEAEVTGNSVYVRSGPSTNYYPVAKLNAGARVRVLVDGDTWLAIEPPPGCYSLIHKNFVDIGPDDGQGVVNGNAVLVRAGSDLSPQIYAKQLKLDRGASVRIIQAHNDDHLRIVPPPGAKLYISKQFVQPTAPRRSGSEVARTDRPQPENTDHAQPPENAPGVADAQSPQPRPPLQPGLYRNRIAEIDAVLTAEEKKPLLHRDFRPIIDRFRELADQQADPHARAYASARIAQLTTATETLAEVRQIREVGEELVGDRKASLQKRDQIRPPMPAIGGGFDAIGELRRSMIYNSPAFPKRFRLVQHDGTRTIGYVEIPAGLKIDMSRFLGRKVGVRASYKRLQTEDVDPLVIYVASELVVLDDKTPATGRSEPASSSDG